MLLQETSKGQIKITTINLDNLIVTKSVDSNLIKEYGTDRFIEGWATIDNLDSYNQRVVTKDVAKTMDTWLKRGGTIDFEHTHYHAGNGYAWEMRKFFDEKTNQEYDGIYIWAYIFNDYIVDNRIWENIVNGIIKSFSIAFIVGDKTVECDESQCHDVFWKSSIFEITITASPVHKQANFKINPVENKSQIKINAISEKSCPQNQMIVIKT